MNTEHYRELLLAKEQELLQGLAHAGSKVLSSTDGEVQDEMDQAVRSEEKEAVLDQSSREFELLTQVRAALRRIDKCTYGTCEHCGRPIDAKRLEAVPWAAFDVKHQDQEERAKVPSKGGSTL